MVSFCSKKVIITSIVVVVVIVLGIGLGVGLSNRPKYPKCYKAEGVKGRIGDGVCDSDLNGSPDVYQHINVEECGWDGGDCVAWNEKYMNCVPGEHPSTLYEAVEWTEPFSGFGLDTGKCNPKYNREACGYDDGNCIEYNEKYADCNSSDISLLGDGKCDLLVVEGIHWVEAPEYNSPQCLYDGGDCTDLNEKYPNCKASKPAAIGDGNCDLRNGDLGLTTWCIGPDLTEYCKATCHNCLTEECGWDGGDCAAILEKYPNCPTEQLWLLGNGICDDAANNQECGFDDGDCN